MHESVVVKKGFHAISDRTNPTVRYVKKRDLSLRRTD